MGTFSVSPTHLMQHSITTGGGSITQLCKYLLIFSEVFPYSHFISMLQTKIKMCSICEHSKVFTNPVCLSSSPMAGW